jgi:hypothetical protein
MNVEKIDKYIHKYEGFFNKTRDFIGNKYPRPKKHKIQWTGQYLFAKKLKKLQNTLIKQHQYKNLSKPKDCELCSTKNIGFKEYFFKKVHWNGDLLHYILIHNYRPTIEFMEHILGHYVSILSGNQIKLPTLAYQKRNGGEKYIKIDKNQLQILDALMYHGGITQKYEDSNGNFKYSEHAGLLSFDDSSLQKFVISSSSTRIVNGDPDILLPTNLIEAYDYEYIFHTHPPTPTPGGRIKEGVLYEFPSASDIAHFIEHSILGVTKGSLVVTPEGLYNIRVNDKHKKLFLFTNELSKKDFLDSITKLQKQIQQKYIQKWGNDFTIDKFYNKIIHDISFIEPLNLFLKKFNIKIDYYPRVKNKKDEWVLNDILIRV